MAALTAPRIRKTAQNTQLTYNLSKRINDVKTYPVQSPQGATILVEANDDGLVFTWRGGRRFKTASARKQEKQNGSSDDAVMVVDSDSDDAPSNEAFETEVEQGPYPEIVQTLELEMNSPVLKIAAMPIPSCAASEAGWGGATLLTERIVVAVTCADRHNYVVSLPLTPPSPKSTARSGVSTKAGSGAWGETVTALGGQRKLSDGIAITLAKHKSTQAAAKSPRAIVAAYSREASGTLRLWDVLLDPKAKQDEPVQPFQTEYLPSPLTAVLFNPHHTTQLMAVSAMEGLRIYDYALPSIPDSEDTGPHPSQGSWLLTLYQPFAKPSATRKPILDAAWIAHGRAILTLLADGMWGIWDVDGASPSASGSSMSTKLKSGVRGAALTAFSVSGYIEGTSSLRGNASHARENESSGEFAPMTPHTRRQATATLSTTHTVDRLAATKGGVSVFTLPATGSAQPDECAALWVASHEHVAVIPGVHRFWETQLRKGSGSGGGVNLFSGAQPTRMVKLLDLSTGLLGERCCGVDLLLDTDSDSQDGGGLPVDILVQGESRLVIVRSSDNGTDLKTGGALTTRRRLFSKGERSNAIIVHGSSGRAGSQSFNLSTAQPGTLRKRPLDGLDDEEDAARALPQPARARVGFEFADTLDAAADVNDEELKARNVEVEMLDIMDIDKALENLNGNGTKGRKKVFFDE